MDISEKVTAATQAAGSVIQQHTNVALHFSGGKDSLACLYLLRAWWPRMTVMWLNSGAALPETVAQMAELARMVPRFMEVHSDQPSQVAIMGLPADVVPTRNTAVGQMLHPGERVLLQHYWECCAANIWVPMRDATAKLGATLIIRGQRQEEQRRAPIRSGHIDGDATILFPIESWTTADVYAYLRQNNIALPAHYGYMNTSLDCGTCTAFADENEGKMRYLRDVHPVIWQETRTRLRKIVDAARFEIRHIEAAAEVA